MSASVLTLAVFAQRGDARVAPDCDAFRFERSQWRTSDEQARRRTILGLDGCGLLTSRSRRQVTALLGPPPGGSDASPLSYGGLSVFLIDERVTGTRVGYDE